MPHYIIQKRLGNKYQAHKDNGILLYLADDTTSNMVAWILGRHTVVVINKYTVIKATPADFKLQDNPNIIIIASQTPDFLTIPIQSQVGAQDTADEGGSRPFKKRKNENMDSAIKIR